MGRAPQAFARKKLFPELACGERSREIPRGFRAVPAQEKCSG